VAAGAVACEFRDNVLAAASTVTGTLVREFHKLDRADFLDRYGYLRPGTYNILSPRYDEAPDRYFDWASSGREAPDVGEPVTFCASAQELRAMRRALGDSGLDLGPSDFLDFLTQVVNYREAAKLALSHNLSDGLRALTAWGERRGLSADDLSHIPIGELRRTRDPGLLRERAAQGRDAYARTQQTRLPPVIGGHQDIWSFEMPPTMPNFITQHCVVGDVAIIERGDDPRDRIAFVPSADPGYDWIFTHRVRGLVTAYGGVNSHMAIRARELGLPAITGAGEARYQEWSSARRIELDAANKVVRILSWPSSR
jgi:glutamine kinase